MILFFYRMAVRLAGPLIALGLQRRAWIGKEDRFRLKERRGHASLARPAGPLLWMHGASVGESLLALPLIEALLAKRRHLHILMTSGTVTSARLMTERLPHRALHQFVPVDQAASWRRFLAHWRPDLGLMIESEIWPNLLHEALLANVPLGLVNGRMSKRSFRRWQQVPRTAKQLFGRFEICLSQSRVDSERFSALGTRHVQTIGNLKHAAAPLPGDQDALTRLRALLDERPIWLAASTHPGEEHQIMAAHGRLRSKISNLLTIIVPRHPSRGDSIAALLRGSGYDVAQRTADEIPLASTDFYIADTVGELGLFYRLALCAFVGGSLVPHGGQNPLEPARLGCPPIFGPHTDNFEEITSGLLKKQAATRVQNAAELASYVARLIQDPVFRSERVKNAMQASEDERAVLAQTLLALAPLLRRSLGPDDADASA